MNKTINVWLDDIRLPPEGFQWVKTAWDAINLIKTGKVGYISLDHDLSDDVAFGTGYDVASYIEEYAYRGGRRIKWNIHSANPVGRRRMEAALMSADRYWRK